MRLRTHLALLVIAAMVPLIVYAGVVVRLLSVEMRQDIDAAIRETARALAAAVGTHVASVVSGLEVIAATGDFARYTPEDLHERASRLIRSQPAWAAITVARADGQVLVNTLTTPGRQAYSLADEPYFRQVVQTKRPALSGYRRSRGAGLNVVSVGVPVVRGGAVQLVLTASLDLDVLSRILHDHALPARWTAAILDANGTIIARSRNADRFVGRKATPRLLERSQRAAEDVFEDVTQEGEPAFGAFARTRNAPWTVVIGLPMDALAKPIRGTLGLALLGGLGLLALGLGLALVLARRIAGPISALSGAATALGRRQPIPPVSRAVAEVAAVAEALEGAAAERDRRERALNEVNRHLEDERQAVSRLHQIAMALTAELELPRLLERLTEEATHLTGAHYGAFVEPAPLSSEQGLAVRVGSGDLPDALTEMTAWARVLAPALTGERPVLASSATPEVAEPDRPERAAVPAGSVLAVPVRGRAGAALGALVFAHPDPNGLTPRHQRLVASVAATAAVALDNARLFQEAQQAIALRDNFVSVASHELRTPLVPLQLQVQSLQRNIARGAAPLSPEALTAALDRMARQVHRLGRLTEDLLDASRIAADRLELRPEPVELVAFVRQIVADFQGEAERTGSTVALEGPEPVEGVWDRARLEQVLANLVSNAFKYGAGAPITIAVGHVPEPDLAFVRVRDGGVGIAPEDHARIFGRFERVGPSHTAAGLGLGLWITDRLVQAMGGRIAVQSEPGQGATFTVCLPRADRGAPVRLASEPTA